MSDIEPAEGVQELTRRYGHLDGEARIGHAQVRRHVEQLVEPRHAPLTAKADRAANGLGDVRESHENHDA